MRLLNLLKNFDVMAVQMSDIFDGQKPSMPIRNYQSSLRGQPQPQVPQLNPQPPKEEQSKASQVMKGNPGNEAENVREAMSKPLATPPVVDTKNPPKLADKGSGGGAKRRMSYVDILNQTSGYKPPTEEEIERESKRNKRNALFSALGDGLTALSNLYFASKGAPDMTSKPLMSEKSEERKERYRKEREADKAAYLKAYMKARQLDDEARWSEDKINLLKEESARDALYDKLDWDEKKRLYGLKGETEVAKEHKETSQAGLNEAKTGLVEQQTETEKVKRGYIPKVQSSIVRKNNAAARNSDAHAAAAGRGGRAGAGRGGRAGGGSNGKYYGTVGGRRYTTKADYDAAVMALAASKGIPTYTIEGGSQRPDGTWALSGTRKNRAIADIAADINAGKGSGKSAPLKTGTINI